MTGCGAKRLPLRRSSFCSDARQQKLVTPFDATLSCLLVLLASCLASCDQSFNPKAPFEERLVVYSVVSNDRDMQFVRVYTNYDVSGFDASENQTDRAVTGARVTITGPSNTFVFKDTLLPRADTSRYDAPIHAYVASPFRAEPGKRYDLVVTSDKLGTASVAVTLPDWPRISFTPGPLVFDQPDLFSKKTLINVAASLSPLCKGDLIQIFVDYQVMLESEWKDERVEVPTAILADTLGRFVVTYPELRRALMTQAAATYLKEAYVRTLEKVLEQYPHKKVTFKRVVLRVLQCEQSLYDYYNTVNGFRDRVSIRVDEPDYTNMRSAMGLFGAYTLDSLTHLFPDNFGLNAK